MREEVDIAGIPVSRYHDLRRTIPLLRETYRLGPSHQVSMGHVPERSGRCRTNGTAAEENSLAGNPHHHVVRGMARAAVEDLHRSDPRRPTRLCHSAQRVRQRQPLLICKTPRHRMRHHASAPVLEYRRTRHPIVVRVRDDYVGNASFEPRLDGIHHTLRQEFAPGGVDDQETITILDDQSIGRDANASRVRLVRRVEPHTGGKHPHFDV